MTRRKERKCASINYSQSIHSINPGLRVNHSHIIMRSSHLASTTRMPNGHHIILDELEDLVIRLDLRPGVILLADDHGPHSFALESLAYSLEHGNDNFLISPVIEPIGIDHWQI